MTPSVMMGGNQAKPKTIRRLLEDIPSYGNPILDPTIEILFEFEVKPKSDTKTHQIHLSYASVLDTHYHLYKCSFCLSVFRRKVLVSVSEKEYHRKVLRNFCFISCVKSPLRCDLWRSSLTRRLASSQCT